MVMKVKVQRPETIEAKETIRIPAGDSKISIELPEAVPKGKFLLLNVRVSGQYREQEDR